jgi:hypothetical protein
LAERCRFSSNARHVAKIVRERALVVATTLADGGVISRMKGFISWMMGAILADGRVI